MEQIQNAGSLYFLHCMSPVHVGTGQGVGAIDLPIVRERVTEWPLIPGSSMKGVQRDYYSSHMKDAAWVGKAFGKPGDQDGAAGALVHSDARILAFPIASLYGTFAYVTCPLVLQRMLRDVSASGIAMDAPDWSRLLRSGDRKDADACIVGKHNVITNDGKLVIDEFECDAIEDGVFQAWAGQLADRIFGDSGDRAIFTERLALVTNEAFQYFVTMCCEVVPRIKLEEDSKTVKNGALWYEEYLPTETIMYGLLWCDPTERRKLLGELDRTAILQIGGNATVGKGRVRCRIIGGEADEVH